MVLFVLLLTTPAFTLLANTRESPQLQSVRIDGLRRTKKDVVLNLITLEPGDTVSADDIQRIQDRLVKSDLFASVTVTTAPLPDTPSSVEMIVTVDEKWTLVPIPFFSTNGDEISGGLILLESNLLGRNKQLISAGFGGTGGVSGFFLFIDPSVFGSNWSSTVSAGTGVSEDETLRPDGERIRQVQLNQQSAGLGIGYRITDSIRIQTRLGAATWQVEDYSTGLDDTEPEDGSYLEPEVGIGYDGTRPIDVLLFGLESSLSSRWVTEEQGWELSGAFSWALPVFETHRLRLTGSGGYGNMPAIAEAPISARDGYRTLPYQAVTADRWGSVAVLYDFPVVSADWGAFVLSHYWEVGAYDTEVLEPQEFYGPGGGFRVYIRQVAIPAVGLDVAYNIADPSWVFSFTVGARM